MDEILSYALMLLILLSVFWFDQRRSNKFHKNIGNLGEDIVANRLCQLTEEYVIKHDVRLNHSQIDHLVINHKLQICFVIETKYWGGTVTGKSGDEYWQQVTREKISYFRNPILQNEFHCRQIRKQYEGYHVYSVIVFVNNKNVPHLKCVYDEHGVVEYIIGVSKKIENKPLNPD